MPRKGEYVARFTGIEPNGRSEVAPEVPPGHLRILYYGDSTCTRFSLAPPARTLIGKYQNGGPVYPEYGHMELGHLFDGEQAFVFHYAISGQRLASVGAPSGTALRARIYEAFNLAPTFRFDIVLIRAGTNDLKFHASNPVARSTDAVFSDLQIRMTEIQRAFECKVVYLGAGIVNLDGNYMADAAVNHLLGGPHFLSEVRVKG